MALSSAYVERRVVMEDRYQCGYLPPSPLGFSQVLILKLVKVLCFDTLLQVLILKEVRQR